MYSNPPTCADNVSLVLAQTGANLISSEIPPFLLAYRFKAVVWVGCMQDARQKGHLTSDVTMTTRSIAELIDTVDTE